MQKKKSFSQLLLFVLLISSPLTKAADWSDTEISLLTGSKFHETNNNTDVKKTIVTLQHASGYKYGRNFFFVDAIKSNSADNNYGEMYGEYYNTLSYSKISGADWSNHFFKDVGLTGGLNYGAKNSAYGPRPEVYLVGPTIDLNVPGFKFFNIDVLAYIDNSSHSGFGAGKSCMRTLTTYQVTPSWGLPFSIAGSKFSFEGFFDVIGKHGSCEMQVVGQPELRWDIGNYFGKADTLYIGVEYQYWYNKFGTRGLKESFPQAMLNWKL